MEEMQVNRQALSTFGANLLSYAIGDTDHTDTYMLPSARIIPVRIKSKIGLRSVSVLLEFQGADLHEVTSMISAFTAEVRRTAYLVLPDGFHYWCVFEKASAPEIICPTIAQVEVEFSGFRHDPIKGYFISQTTSVYLPGNCETPLRLTVTPLTADVHEFTVCGVTVKNVTEPVIIDGIKTTITSGGKNKFKDAANLTEWPSISPGSTTITMTPGVKVHVEFYPIYQ